MHRMQGWRPMTYWKNSAARRAPALASTRASGIRAGLLRSSWRGMGRLRAMTSENGQHHDTADQRHGEGGGDQHQPLLDEGADRLAEFPQQCGDEEEAQAARNQRGHGELEEIELE